MAQKARKNYVLKLTSNQPTTQNIKSINDSIYNESSLRNSAIASLNSQIQTLLSQITILQEEINALETEIDSIDFQKQTFTLTPINIANGYIELSGAAKNKSIRMEMGCFILQEDVDYSVSIENNKTRITFIDNPLEPFFEIGDILFVQYYIPV